MTVTRAIDGTPVLLKLRPPSSVETTTTGNTTIQTGFPPSRLRLMGSIAIDFIHSTLALLPRPCATATTSRGTRLRRFRPMTATVATHTSRISHAAMRRSRIRPLRGRLVRRTTFIGRLPGRIIPVAVAAMTRSTKTTIVIRSATLQPRTLSAIAAPIRRRLILSRLCRTNCTTRLLLCVSALLMHPTRNVSFIARSRN